MKKIDIIIFDLDGTLVDSKTDIATSINHARAALGLPEKNVEEISRCVGGGLKETVKKTLGEEGERLIDKAVVLFKEHYKKNPVKYSRLYPGVRKTLSYFSSKILSVVTNKDHDITVKILKELEIYDLFAYVTGGDDPECRKPSPCPVNSILEKTGVPKDKAVIVGDMDIDIITAQNAGISSCAVTYGIGKKEDITRTKPDYIIHRITELRDIFSKD